MKQWKLWLVAGLLVAVASGQLPMAYASVLAEDTDATELDHAHRIRGALAIVSNNTALLGGQRCETFGPEDFIGVGDGTALPVRLSGTTTPALATITNLPYLRWADAESHKAQTTFSVPSKYYSGGTLIVYVGRSGSGDTPPVLDFEVFVNRDLTAFDAAATNQTSVSVTSNIASGSMEKKTLTVATDFGSLAAGDLISWNVWREATGTETLRLFGAQFCYNARD